jgi:predicted phage terminase large subunit-like protein
MAACDGRYFVLDVTRTHDEPRVFRSRVQLLRETHPTATACAYAAATEMGGVEFFRDGGIPIEGRIARQDKFSRAIPFAAAWNAGKVLLPRSALWLDSFVSEICGFTGVKDRHDDQVDAAAAAFDALHGSMHISSDDFYRRVYGDSEWTAMSGDSTAQWRNSDYAVGVEEMVEAPEHAPTFEPLTRSDPNSRGYG